MKIKQIEQIAESHGIDIATATPASFAKLGVKVSSNDLWRLRRFNGVALSKAADRNKAFQSAIVGAGKDTMDVAIASGVNYATLCRWVKCGVPNIAEIAAICDLLCVSPRDLIENKQP